MAKKKKAKNINPVMDMNGATQTIRDFKLPQRIIDELVIEFDKITKKHGIAWGTPSPDGKCVTGSTPEWSACGTLFLKSIEYQVQWGVLFPVKKTVADAKKRLKHDGK